MHMWEVHVASAVTQVVLFGFKGPTGTRLTLNALHPFRGKQDADGDGIYVAVIHFRNDEQQSMRGIR